MPDLYCHPLEVILSPGPFWEFNNVPFAIIFAVTIRSINEKKSAMSIIGHLTAMRMRENFSCD